MANTAPFDTKNPFLFYTNNNGREDCPRISDGEISILAVLWQFGSLRYNQIQAFSNRHRRRIGLEDSSVPMLWSTGRLFITDRLIVKNEPPNWKPGLPASHYYTKLSQVEVLLRLLNTNCLGATGYSFSELIYRYIEGDAADKNMVKIFQDWDLQRECVAKLFEEIRDRDTTKDTRSEPQDDSGEAEAPEAQESTTDAKRSL